MERKSDKILSIAKQRGFLWGSSEIYGGIAGFFDYGPMGALLKRNIENAWRKLFIVREGLFEIETPTIMPKEVFMASGHLDHFTDPLTECAKCGENYRADHLIQEIVKKETEGMGLKELNELMKKHNIVCKKCKGSLAEVWSYNLMFSTEVGSGKKKRDANMRPETAQGAFTSFPRLFSVARKKMPFGACQIGKAYRNEISPRQGMVRLREFSQAEMEYFYNPKEKKHSKFDSIKNYTLPLYPAEYQESGKAETLEITANDAVKKGIIDSELIAYFLTISEKFFEGLGIPRTAIRCRQQLKDERAHYSSETWDVEIESEDFGWIEVCAVADRTDYDLNSHAALSKEKMQVNIEGEKFVPHVLEASFGIDRPIWCVLEHSFMETEKRTFFAIDKSIAPVQIGVFPLVSKDELPKKAQDVFDLLVDNHLMVQYDEKGSIGRRYARADEVGTPYCITIDYDTLKDDTVTVRERDSMEQERVKIEELVEKLK